MLETGTRVVHIADSSRTHCHLRKHGVVDHAVPLEKSILGKAGENTPPEWIGVRWDDLHDGVHPPQNIQPCTCPTD